MFANIKAGYKKIQSFWQSKGAQLGAKIRALMGRAIDADMLEKLEEILYQADIGIATAQELMQKVEKAYQKQPKLDCEQLIQLLQAELLDILLKIPAAAMLEIKTDAPHIILIIGSNGHGKTTSIAKLAYRYKKEGHKVLLIAADTFRAAATEQLTLWAEQIGIDIVKGQFKSDPAAVIFDGLAAAKARSAQVVLIDTAGRLHTKTDLMQELEKLRRVTTKAFVGAPQETLLVLDATTGSSAVEQAQIFHQYTPVTGIILTKLDGTAKGGSVIAIQKQTGIPVRWIGLGEKVDDLEKFEAKQFVQALFE